MATRDGNGWTTCGLGHRHWGRHGAAGLLAYTGGGPGGASVLLQRRSHWNHHGGTWGTPGGAMDSHESVVAAALREAAEECGVPADAVTVTGVLADDHGSWSYRTVLGAAATPFPVYAASAETAEAAWVHVAKVGRLTLHPGFAAQWPVLREALQPMAIIVDAANVMGSRPDGWWRDRAGAAARLRDELAGLAERGLTALPPSVAAPPLERWFPDFVLVVEGRAREMAGVGRGAAGPGGAGGAGGAGGTGGAGGPGRVGGTGGAGARVRVVAAPGSGDDAIAELAGELTGRRLVVTADRELRGRCAAAGASVTGPSWLLGLL
jgi:8-oxo-dGTP pyrophosphatase MutT (NUDIX family)